MKRILNASLKHLNSFSVHARASQLIELNCEDDLHRFTSEYRFDPCNDLILGGGSNILFARDIEGTVILNRVKGKKISEDSDDQILLEVNAGENWHELVLWSLDQGLSGLENLSLIPGLVGAAPIQNIGAYGVELSDVLDSVQVLDLESGEFYEFPHKECQFAYRSSRFKSASASRHLITRIRLRLGRKSEPNLGYKGLNEELRAMGVSNVTAREVSEAVIRIRRRRLPDPQVIGNAGSFFKNPLVSRSTADLMKREFDELPVFMQSDNTAKLSAAWLIEKCGWKGRGVGRAAVSDQHALVLVNKGNATGSEILVLANNICASVKTRFGIELQAEPRIIQ